MLIDLLVLDLETARNEDSGLLLLCVAFAILLIPLPSWIPTGTFTLSSLI